MSEDWFTLESFVEKHFEIISMGGLRWILFKSEENGSDYFVRKIGRRKLLVSEKRFFEWLEKNERIKDEK